MRDIGQSLNGQITSVSSFQPINLLFHQDNYLIQDMGSKNVFTLINTETMSPDTLLGTRGGGPNEFNNVYMFLRNKSNKHVNLTGFNTIDKRFYEYRITQNPETKKVVSTVLEPITESFYEMQHMIQNFTLVDDTTIACTDNINQKIDYYSLGLDKTLSIPFSREEIKLLNESKGLLGTNIINLLPGLIASHTLRKEVVYANRNLGYIEVYPDIKSNKASTKVILGASFENRINELSKNVKTPSFYLIDLAATEDNVYVLYLGSKSDQAMGLDSSLHTSVLVFNYALELKSNYQLDAFIGTFVVNEKRQELVGMDYGDERFTLIRYTMPD